MKNVNKQLVEMADSIEDLATIICGHGFYAYHNDDVKYPIPKDAVKEYLEMGAQLITKCAKYGTVQKDNQVLLDDGAYIDLDPSMSLKPSFPVKEGERVKVLFIKEDIV